MRSLSLSGSSAISASARASSGTASGHASSRIASASSTLGACVSSAAQLPGAVDAAQVPAVELAEEPDGALFAHLAHHLAHEPDELGDHLVALGVGAAGAGHLAQRPRPALRAAADHHRGGAGVGEHPLGRLPVDDVAGGDDGHGDQRRPARPSACGRRTPVYICWAERGWSVSAATPRSSSRGPRSSAAREPFFSPRRILTVTGTSTASTTAPATRQRKLVILERAGTGAGLGDLAHRAAHVDVDDVRAGIDDHPSGLGHPLRL